MSAEPDDDRQASSTGDTGEQQQAHEESQPSQMEDPVGADDIEMETLRNSRPVRPHQGGEPLQR